MSELLKLAERCEQATGPTYDLFEQAFALCFPDNYMPGRSGFGPFRWSEFKAMLDVRAYLDAASSLVPEGWQFGCGSQDSTMRPWAWVGQGGPLNEPYSSMHPANAVTPTLALCAAALRARAAQGIEAQRAETGTGSVHESPVAASDAPNDHHHNQASLRRR